MSSLFSPSWYRVAALKPSLRAHFEVHRQPSGQHVSFLLQDHATGKFFRFDANAYEIIGRMNGERTVHDIWESVVACKGDEAPGQEETIGLLGRLHAADALQASVTPDCLELFRRSQRVRQQKWKRMLKSPLSLRLPLLDPDRALVAMLPFVGPLFSIPGLVVWTAVVAWAMVLAVSNWSALAYEAGSGAFEAENLLLLGLVYPLVKALHELGHAITTRKWGGEVHEVGLTLLVLVPVPYVDASAASAIRSRWKRIVVSAAGMMVELFLAAIALLIWLNVEPGLVRSVAFNVMLIGSVSTVLFNGNPLLRFDAYYILRDAIEIPNLASRSTAQLRYLAKRYLFGMASAESSATRPGERRWLVFYGIASTAYRLVLTFTIVLFVAGKFFFIGVVLAVWAFIQQVLAPIVKFMGFVLLDPALERHRARAVTVSTTTLASVLAGIMLVPVPSATLAEGVLWLPERAHVNAGADGVVKALLAEPYSQVSEGQPLLALEDPLLEARLAVLESELEELEVRRRIEKLENPVAATLREEAIEAKRAEIEQVSQRASRLVVESGSSGVFVLRRASDVTGRYVRQGDRLGVVLDRSAVTVRVVVPQDRIGLVREQLHGVEVKLAEAPASTIPAALARTVPAAQTRLPSKVLGTAGGGRIPVDPTDEQGLTTRDGVFELDVTLEREPSAWRVGQRAHVRLDHGNQPLAVQWLRLGRQLFLSRFGV